MLESFNYNPKKGADRRRKILKTAIQTHSFDSIYQELKQNLQEFDGYKKDRIEYDLRWLKKNSHKYYSEILQASQENKIAN